MATVEIYTKQNCLYCVRAKQLFDKKKVKYTEIPVDQDEAALKKMLFRSEGRRTVPQIFIDNRAIGGCDDLYALDETGQLDRIIKS